MNVLLQSSEILLEHVHLCDWDLFFHAELLTNFKNRIQILQLVKVGHITSIEDVIDVFELLLLDYLGVHEEE